MSTEIEASSNYASLNGVWDYRYYDSDVGFRCREIVGNRFLVNGLPVKFKGVNIHEHNQFTGHYIAKEDIMTDLRLMKEHNMVQGQTLTDALGTTGTIRSASRLCRVRQ